MAKVFGFCIFTVKYDIQIDVTLILVALGNLELHAGLCFCIFRYPLLYQRTGKTWCLHVAYATCIGRITLSPNAADVDTQ